MLSTRLSSKGQVIIPESVRALHHWMPGQDLEVVDTPEGVFLRIPSLFPATTLDAVAGILAYAGPAKSIEEMEAAIARGVADRHGDR